MSMKDWCDQSKGPCPTCNGDGYIATNDHDTEGAICDPLTGGYVVPCPNCPVQEHLHLWTKKRPGWDEIWIGLAIKVGKRSTCKVPNREIGCIIVSDDNTKVLAVGYNGSAKGDDNGCEYDGDTIKIGSSRCTCAHAEMNALTKLDTSNPCRKKMYLTLTPCDICYKLIRNAEIDEVIFLKIHKMENVNKLKKLGVEVRQYEDNKC